ncbi:MAG: hypothetical protein K2X47_17025, partial [Bdellovibrionales bacterium]|nr:hypothetical protein [Bdellovibrionales bacterium]
MKSLSFTSLMLILAFAAPAYSVTNGESCSEIAARSAEALENRINSALDPMWPGMEAGDLASVTIADRLLISTRALLREVAQLIQTSHSGLQIPEQHQAAADKLESTLKTIYTLSEQPEKKFLLLGKTNLQKIQAMIPSLKELL